MPRRIARASRGGTIAVLAGGQDRVYPPEHIGLLDEILPAGAALTEMPFGWEPRARDFPRRNRLGDRDCRHYLCAAADHA
jgi:predicted Rossmann fold nucleotide-binding protein DprA/Smf involved in DNA uptake